MPEQIFVGRQRYLDQFREMLAASVGSYYILNLRGYGGIGKTKILEEIVKICNDNGVLHTPIIDFYEPELSSRIGAVEKLIIKNLGGEYFSEYVELDDKLKERDRTPIDAQRLKVSFRKGLEVWSSEALKTGKRGVFVFDTFEQAQNSLVGFRLINDWLLALKSTIVVVAGRQKENEIRFPQEVAHLIIDQPVENFTRPEAIEYLETRKVWRAVQEEGIVDGLFELTELRPLRLALSADWMYKNPTSLKELVSKTEKEDFERKLVQGLHRVDIIPEPENLILPYMAHIIRPFDTRLIGFLDLPNVPFEKAEEMLNNLSFLSFVKYRAEDERFWLQDEVRYLFRKHIFESDPIYWQGVREDASKKMVEYYENRIQTTQNNHAKHQIYIARQLYNEVFLDPIKASDKFRKLFGEARNNLQYDFVSVLVGSMRLAFDNDYLPEEQAITFRIAEARGLGDIGEAQLALERFEGLLKDYENEPKRAVYIYNGLGGVYLKLGWFDLARGSHVRALELRKELGLDETTYLEEGSIGLIYQHTGAWEQAVEHLNLAHELALQYEVEWRDIAQLETSLGYVYGLLGEYDASLRYFDQAIQTLETLSRPNLVARAKVWRADIYRRLGDYHNRVDEYNQGIDDIEKAIPLFESRDVANIARAYFFLGHIQWYKSLIQHDLSLLTTAKESFEFCIGILEEHGLELELSQALHEVSDVYWLLGLKTEARSAIDRAYDRSNNSHNIQYALNSLVKQAEFDFSDKLYEHVFELATKIKSDFEDKGYPFPLFYGRIRRLLGEIAFERHDYEQIITLYGEGLSLIAQHGGYGVYKLSVELGKLQDRLKDIDAKKALTLCRELKSFWKQIVFLKNKPTLLGWADKQISYFSFQLRSLQTV